MGGGPITTTPKTIYGFLIKGTHAQLTQTRESLSIKVISEDGKYGVHLDHKEGTALFIYEDRVDVYRKAPTHTMEGQALYLFRFMRDKYIHGKPDPEFMNKQLLKWVDGR